ncbi:MAG: histidinol-phosphatase HisJ family protein [Lachnospiraceae bacterium]|jgi:histidinol-phosphatase (PHP family)|nr:histidinol-phosphatase HisJ family protein [Lachnospiraceae bacterium]
MYYPDHHVHSHFSPDSEALPEQHAETAILLGMPAICFTDHMDFDYPKRYNVTFDLHPAPYLDAMEKLRAQYDGRISIRAGLEIGLEAGLRPKITDYILSSDWDFVIGSIHMAGRKDPYFEDYFEGRSTRDAYRAYFEDTLDCLSSFDPVFDVVGHLDYVLRNGNRSVTNAWKEWPDLMDEILRLTVKKGLGLDINTGGIRKGLSFQHPHDDLLRRYRQLGGEIITFGSDAHAPGQLGYHFPETGERLKALGFRYYASYQKRKPAFFPL